MAEAQQPPGDPAPLEADIPVTADSIEELPAGNLDAHLDVPIEAIREGDYDRLGEWAEALGRSTAFWTDIALLGGSILLAWILYRLFQRGRLPNLRRIIEKIPSKRKLRLFRITLLLTTWATVLVAGAAGIPCLVLRTFALILTCFVFVNLPSKFIHWKSWMSVISATVFAVAALHILGLLDDTIALLDRHSLDLGTVSLSILDLLVGLIALILLFWAAGIVSNLISRRISKVDDLSPNVRVLLGKVVRITLFILAVLVTLGLMGIKITTLAVFGGALGIGLGFGLQKVVSNLVSGIILLLDKSIKPGDVIEIGTTYGWINSLNLRYVSVVTRDNKEHLIPNEDLITNPVINWSFSSKLVRIAAPFGVAYSSDIRLAMKLATECAEKSNRVVASPAPRCNLMGFGDSSVELELRFWIEDPHNGVGRVRSEVLLEVWDAFHENGIEFPFPQRDVHLRLAGDTDPEALLKTLSPEPENQ